MFLLLFNISPRAQFALAPQGSMAKNFSAFSGGGLKKSRRLRQLRFNTENLSRGKLLSRRRRITLARARDRRSL